MNIIDRFSTHLREVLVRSIRIATELQDASVEPIHLFFALSMQKGSIANEILHRCNITAKKVEQSVEHYQPAHTEPAASMQTAAEQKTILSPFSLTARTVLEKALVIAQKNGHNYLGTEHLLAALLDLHDPWLQQFLHKNKIRADELENQLDMVLANATQFPQITEVPEALDRLQDSLTDEIANQSVLPVDQLKKGKKKESILDFFATNLTNPDIQANIDPVIGRESEIERLMQVLCRRTKNNPVLLGDPGVGKTAIVEGLAKKIIQGNVPSLLLNKKIYALDMGLLIAGTAYRGEFEARLRQVIEEVVRDPNIIVFVDELHNIVGAGSNQGTMDAANILKPVLARGSIRCIGATTPGEYKKYVESDPALERRFQPIVVKESTAADTLKILAGIRKNYETYHNLRITDKALETAVQLADRYITNKFFPDKAIDLLDETAAAKRLQMKPSELETKIWQLQQEYDQVVQAKEEAATADRFDEAVRLKDREKKLHAEIEALKLKARQHKTKPSATITEDDVVNQVAKMVDTPVSKLLLDGGTLTALEREFKKYIVGQDEVVHEVSQLIRQAQLELSHPQRPLASFLFVGESGVGKSELAKTLAKVLYPNQSSLIQLNMSEFSESYGVSKLLGSPAGYVGYKESNQFTDRIKLNPYCVILFDEIEKAHRDVSKLLLQMLEDGEVTDATGKKISLKHTIIILTTTLGSDEIKRALIGFGQHGEQTEQRTTRERMKEYFSPELINRIDQICLFNSLSKEDLAKIAALEVDELNKRLRQYNTNVKADQAILQWLVSQLPERQINARDVRRKVRHDIENLMAQVILRNKRIKARHKLMVHDNKLKVT